MNLRRRVATALDEVSRILGQLSDLIDPPRPADRSEPSSREEALQRAEARTRHPAYGERPQTILGDVAAQEQHLAEVVPFPRPEEEPDRD